MTVLWICHCAVPPFQFVKLPEHGKGATVVLHYLSNQHISPTWRLISVPVMDNQISEGLQRIGAWAQLECDGIWEGISNEQIPKFY